MQNEEFSLNQSLSRLRQELRRLVEELERSLVVAYERSPLIKGNVYEITRKCGKPNCACTRGQLHKSMVLSWSHQGKTRLKSVPPEKLAELSRKSEEYLRFRRARAQVTIIYKQMLEVIDHIETLRREEP
ncbi:MAG: hypothetical protein PHU23_19040 [Dehalococcoidales bacterium]|nr:hypothetical protein [Dehalococcoidales bacterium]